MEKERVLEAFRLLSIDEERKEFNKELTSLMTLVDKLLESYDGVDTKPVVYRSNIDYQKDERDVLVDNYSNILDLKNDLILLLSYMDKNR
ncbi:MAG: hypothetical protein IKP07_02065 [Bacilli bacterium]|nr:hypothetical protein [Bacilli bacterium]